MDIEAAIARCTWPEQKAPRVAVGHAHVLLAAQLPEEWTARRVYDNHEVMMFHGQRCCFHAAPDCGRCPLLDLYPFGRNRAPLALKR